MAVHTFLTRPLPYPEPERLVSLFERNVVSDEQQRGVAAGNFPGLAEDRLELPRHRIGSYV